MNERARQLPMTLRIISDNDFCGDPDGLVQLAHLLLSPLADVRAVIGSHMTATELFETPPDTATASAAAARRIVELTGRTDVSVVEGSNARLPDRTTPVRSAGAATIVAEAMSESDLPLFVVLGGSLTELASAYLLEPAIADRLTAVWIGGPEHPGLAEAPWRPQGPELSEFNLRLDTVAAQVVFDSRIPLWQVPRDAYRQTLVGFAELATRMRPAGPLGRALYEALDRARDMLPTIGFRAADTFTLGDSPLVLLTALHSTFEPDAASSRYVVRAAPAIADDGTYVERADGRPIRVYTQLDVRLMHEDFFAKLALHAAR